MASFFAQTKITDPERIFGRERDLEVLSEYAASLTQIQIIGARRFGKTTVSLCLETKLRNDEASNVYPIYTDVKTARIKGTANFYRYLIAVLTSRLCADKVFTSRQKFGMTTIKPSCEYIKVFSELTSCPDAYLVDTFVKLASFFADKMNKTILVIFDEYEYMAKSTIDNLDGFMPLRDFSTDYLDSGVRPFIFWLVGARPWGFFVRENKLSNVDVIGGSGEFNNVEIEHYLKPISKDSFLSFWQSRCDEFFQNPSEEKSFIASYANQVYECISGIPFYGSSVAHYLKANKSYPDYTVIKSHLDEALRIFDSTTVSYLRSLCKPQVSIQDDQFDLLSNYGLICVSEDGICSLSMSYLRDYLIKKFPIIESKGEDSVRSTKKDSVIGKLVDSIDLIIENINETCRNKGRDPIFAPTEEERRNREVLKRVCSNEEDFGHLLETLAKVYYERSKAWDPVKSDNVPGYRLAELEAGCKPIYKSRQFFQVLEPLRTYYAAHLRDKVDRKNPYQIDKGPALAILQGHKNEPDTPDQWYQLQLKLLQLFKAELNTVKQKVMNLP